MVIDRLPVLDDGETAEQRQQVPEEGRGGRARMEHENDRQQLGRDLEIPGVEGKEEGEQDGQAGGHLEARSAADALEETGPEAARALERGAIGCGF